VITNATVKKYVNIIRDMFPDCDYMELSYYRNPAYYPEIDIDTAIYTNGIVTNGPVNWRLRNICKGILKSMIPKQHEWTTADIIVDVQLETIFMSARWSRQEPRKQVETLRYFEPQYLTKNRRSKDRTNNTTRDTLEKMLESGNNDDIKLGIAMAKAQGWSYNEIMDHIKLGNDERDYRW
jgi:hypothetical protein